MSTSVKSEDVELPRPRPRGLESERVRANVLLPPSFPRKLGYNNPGESQELMPPPTALPVPREGLKKPTTNLESQLMPPPAVIPCEPPVTMRHVGDFMSSNLRQGKQKEEIGKTRTCGPGRPAACTVIGSISLQIRITHFFLQIRNKSTWCFNCRGTLTHHLEK